MRRFSIVRSVRLALLGLTILLAALAGVGIASLYSTRQRYEDHLAAAYALEAGAAKLLAASVVEEATLRTAHGRHAGRARARARAAFEQAAAETRSAAAGDPLSAQLVAQAIALQAALRAHKPSGSAALAARTQIVALADRQAQRRVKARSDAKRDSRHALIAVLLGGGLALLAVLALVSALLARVRQPLSELVVAARRLARGELDARVPDSGPDELRELGAAFNAMAADLADALARLEAERARLDLTIRSLGDALLVVDGAGRVVTANPRAAELLPELAPGTLLAEARPQLPPLADALAREVTIERGGRTLAATAARLPADEEGEGVVWTVRDVTERARLERLKSEFVATASHELRSPLTSIKGFVELLAQGRTLTRKQRDFIDIIHASTNRLVDLVNDLLDVAQIEAGHVEIQTRAVDLADVVHDVASLMQPRLRDKHQTLEIEIEPEVPHALADPMRLRQILTNLLTNAHLYTDPGGHVRISCSAHERGVALSVSDDGHGMSEEQLDHAFERFYRGGGGEGRPPGSGLGLAIVKSLVDLHDGTIDVRSALGEGTTFTVVLARAPVSDAPDERRAALAGRRVLVIDDEPEVADLIAARLAPFGVECAIATSGAEAIERLHREPYDAVTLDILMPGTSGFDLLGAMRGDPALQEIPVVVVSVFSGREALAGEWVVSKPIDTDELADALGGAMLAGGARPL